MKFDGNLKNIWKKYLTRWILSGWTRKYVGTRTRGLSQQALEEDG